MVPWLKYRLAKAGKQLRHEAGAGLIEALIALALTGTAIVTLLAAFSTGTEAVVMTDEMVTARNLAQDQIEYVQQYPYDPGTTTYPVDPSIDIPADYVLSPTQVSTLSAVASELLPWGATEFMGQELPQNQNSMQYVTATVVRNGEVVFEISTFKVNR